MADKNNQAFDCRQSFDDRLQLVNRQLLRYRENADVEAIHDLRTSIRRLQAAYSAIPPQARAPRASEYMDQLGQLFKLNSQLRDNDVIAERLLEHPEKVQALIAELEGIRQTELQQTEIMVAAVATLPGPEILECPGDSWRQRVEEIQRRADKIEKRQPRVIADEEAIEELHELRKDMKKLFYLLELHDSTFSEKQRQELRRVQKLAGAIHDCDITVSFLQQFKSPDYDVAASITDEQEKRHKLYMDFKDELASRRWHKMLATALSSKGK